MSDVIYAGEKQDLQRRTGENRADKGDIKGERESLQKR